MTGEISYDLVMGPDMPFVEGTFRLPGGEWRVVIVSKRPVPSVVVHATTWESGVAGFFVEWPEGFGLDAASVETLLGRLAGVDQWVRVAGPDSMQLR